MTDSDAKRRHDELDFAGFRALATAAGFLQLVRELRAVAVLDETAISRVREAMLQELLENVARPFVGDVDYEQCLRRRLEALFAGSETQDANGAVPR